MAEVEAAPGRNSSKGGLKSLVVIVVAVAVLMVVSTASVLLVGGPSRASYTPGTPQAAFQNWLSAANAGDWTTADTYLSSSLIAQGVSSEQMAGPSSATRPMVTIDSAQLGAQSATLFITIQGSSGSGIGAGTYASTSSVQMVLENGSWKIDSQSFGIY